MIDEFRKLRQRLDDPRQLRALVTGLILAVGFAGVYMPLSSRIDKMARVVDKEERRHALAEEIEQLRAQVDSFQARLPEDTDTNEWIQYVLAGIRKFPVALVRLDPGEPERVGPYEAVVLHLEIVGEYQNLDSFLDWIEANERLFRVDSMKITPPRGGGNQLLMQLAVQGVKG